MIDHAPTTIARKRKGTAFPRAQAPHTSRDQFGQVHHRPAPARAGGSPRQGAGGGWTEALGLRPGQTTTASARPGQWPLPIKDRLTSAGESS